MAHVSGGSDEPITAINITPLVDVSLVLVIVFMITMPYLMEKAMRVKSADQPVVPVSSPEEPVLIEISRSGVLLEGRPQTLEGLAPALKLVLDKRGMRAVAVSAEADVNHGAVVEVLDQAAAAGASELNVMEPAQGGGNGHGPA